MRYAVNWAYLLRQRRKKRESITTQNDPTPGRASSRNWHSATSSDKILLPPAYRPRSESRTWNDTDDRRQSTHEPPARFRRPPNRRPPARRSTAPSHRPRADSLDRKSTRLNSSHSSISYAVFCSKKIKHHIRCLTE